LRAFSGSSVATSTPVRAGKADKTPRYLIEGSFTDARAIQGNGYDGVTWLHSYVRDDGKKAFCVYDAPSPEALRHAAARSGLTVDTISEVRVLVPYPYAGGGS
jgi:Nickel responsive protein SCO4226-like